MLTPRIGDFRRLYRFRQGQLVPVTPEMPHDVSAFSIDEPRRRILYNVNQGGYTRLRAMDARTFAELPLPALPAADHVRFGATTSDGRYTTLSVDTGRAPVSSYVVDWTTGGLAQWHTPSAPELDTSRFAVASLESYPARDGTRIPMFVRRPESCPTKPCPVIVNFHGGPEGQAYPGFRAGAQLFVDAGFVYVEPNVRGSEGYGGYSALTGMTMFARAYDAGASSVGIANLLTFLENTAPYRRPLRITEYGDPEKDRDALVKLSPITYVDRVKAPLLVIQGANDPRVPVSEATQIHDALAAKKIDSLLIVFPDEGHGSQKRDNRVLERGHILQFFQKHLAENAVGLPG